MPKSFSGGLFSLILGIIAWIFPVTSVQAILDKLAVASLSFLLLFVDFAHFCALVCKIGFLFFNFPRFCTIDLWDGVAIGEYGS